MKEMEATGNKRKENNHTDQNRKQGGIAGITEG
jgi:hypothetical protein